MSEINLTEMRERAEALTAEVERLRAENVRLGNNCMEWRRVTLLGVDQPAAVALLKERDDARAEVEQLRRKLNLLCEAVGDATDIMELWRTECITLTLTDAEEELKCGLLSALREAKS